MGRRTYAAAMAAMLASALWIEGATTPAAAANVIPCRQYLCPLHSRATCFQTKSVTKYINDIKYTSVCCVRWTCTPPGPRRPGPIRNLADFSARAPDKSSFGRLIAAEREGGIARRDRAAVPARRTGRRRDFAPVALTIQVPFVLVVHPSLPVRSAPQLIEFAKQKPDQVVYASGGLALRITFSPNCSKA